MAQRIDMEEFGRDANVPPPTTARTEQRTIGGLIRELGDDSTRLIQEEVRLARAEVREKVQVYERNAVTMAIGGVLVLGSVLVLLVAVNRGLTVLLEQFMPLEIAVWVAPLILAAVVGLIGWSMIKKAQSAMRREGVTPTRTVETLRDEGRWMKDRAQEVRHG